MSGTAGIIKAGAVILLAYAAGSIPWGFLIGKFNGLDLRRHGSGNIGATNVNRVLGKDWAILCLVLDVLKGLVPVLVAMGVSRGSEDFLGGLLPVCAAFATVAGHIWPFTLNFKGGKGVATSVGALVALAPWSVLAATLAWVVVFETSRYVSVASMSAAIVLPLTGLILCIFRNGTPSPATVVLLAALGVTVIVRHRGNLARLRNGTESRFERKKREKKE